MLKETHKEKAEGQGVQWSSQDNILGEKRPFEESGDRVYGNALKIKDKKYGLVFLDQAESRRKDGGKGLSMIGSGDQSSEKGHGMFGF